MPDLVCVINYSCPNHLEDYVHRVGRTGRAGRKGTAYTFISAEEDKHAPTLIKALTQSKQKVVSCFEAMQIPVALEFDPGSACRTRILYCFCVHACIFLVCCAPHWLMYRIARSIFSSPFVALVVLCAFC